MTTASTSLTCGTTRLRRLSSLPDVAPNKSEPHILVARAIERALELVGEAANRVDAESQALYPAIPWRGLIGLRNVIVHGYDRVDYDTLARVVFDELPGVVASLNHILGPDFQ